MAITLVQHAQNKGAATASVTVTLSSTGAGNCLVVCIGLASGTDTISSVTLGGSAGNFAQLVTKAAGASAAAEVFIWADPNCTGSQTSLVVTPSASVNTTVDVFEFSGVLTASPLDKSASGNDGGTAQTSFTSTATATTTQAAEAWVGAVCTTDNSTTLTGPSSPWTNETSQIAGTKSNPIVGLSGYQITSSTGAATYSGTIGGGGGAQFYGAAVVTLKPGAVTSTGAMSLDLSMAATSLGGNTTSTGAMTMPPAFHMAATDAETFSATGGLSMSSLAMAATGGVFPTFPTSPLGLTIQLLLNGTWTDITQYVYQRQTISITNIGRPNEAQSIQSAQMTLVLNNTAGWFTPLLSSSPFYPYIKRNTQIRVNVQAASRSGVTYSGYRFWGVVSAWPTGWDASGNDVYVTIAANGIWQQLSQNTATIGSAIKRYVAGLTGSSAPLAYWPMEDGSNSTQIASALSGGSAVTWTGTPSLSADRNFAGSDALPQMNGAVFSGTAGSYSSGGSSTYTVPGTYTWFCPVGNTTVQAECWGASGGGGFGTNNDGGGASGGGGEFAEEPSAAVTAGTGYTVVVGAGGSGSSGQGSGGSGGNSTFTGDSVTVTGHGGTGGGDSTALGLGSAGVAGSGSTNTTHHSGGAGAQGSAGPHGAGAGGGSSGGTAAAGNAGSAGSGTTGGAGGAAVTGGGAGGGGGNWSSSCVDSYTRIWTTRGLLTYDQVREGDITLAMDSDGQMVRSEVTNVRVFKDARPTLVTLSGPLSARTTLAHRWLVRTAEGLAWRTTATLEPGDLIRLGRQAAPVSMITIGEPVVDESAIIWCPTTDHGTWLACRGGIAHFTGNKP